MKARVVAILYLVLLPVFVIYIDSGNVLTKLASSIMIPSSVLYIIWTRFGMKDNIEVQKLEYENQFLEERIKHIELTKKLKEFPT